LNTFQVLQAYAGFAVISEVCMVIMSVLLTAVNWKDPVA